jgi:hypothetical protein
MLVNFAWPRIASNPEPRQVGLSYGISFLNKIPILYTVAIGIAVIGAIYYLITGRRKEFAPVTAPSGDDPIEQPAGESGAAA